MILALLPLIGTSYTTIVAFSLCFFICFTFLIFRFLFAVFNRFHYFLVLLFVNEVVIFSSLSIFIFVNEHHAELTELRTECSREPNHCRITRHTTLSCQHNEVLIIQQQHPLFTFSRNPLNLSSTRCICSYNLLY